MSASPTRITALSCLALLLLTTVSCSTNSEDDVRALIRVRMNDEVSPDRRYELYRDSQIALMTSPFVIRAAMRGLAEPTALPTLNSMDDPAQWLQENVHATYEENSELINVTCPALPDEEAAAVINAILKAYQQEVMQTDRNHMFVQLEALESRYREIQQRMREKADELHRLAVQLGIDNSVAQVRREIAVDKIKSIQQRVSDLEDKLLAARAKQMLAKLEEESSEIGHAESDADAEVGIYELLLSEQKAALELAVEEIATLEGFSAEYVTKELELQQLKDESLARAQEIASLKMNLSQPARTQLLQQASSN